MFPALRVSLTEWLGKDYGRLERLYLTTKASLS